MFYFQEDKKIILVKKELRDVSNSKESGSQPKLLLKPKIEHTKSSEETEANNANSSNATSLNISQGHSKNNDNNIVAIDDSHAVISMTEPVSFLTSDFSLNLETIAPYLQENNNDFLVVTAIGLQNSGKSTLLNMIENDTMECTADIKRHCLFKIRGNDQCDASILPLTEGIKVYVTKDRVILLDCEPLLTNFRYNEYILYELEELKLLVFLLNICDLVIVLQDVVINPSLLRLICCAELMLTNKEQKEVDRHANLMFVHNKVSKTELNETNVNQVKSIYKKVFATTKLNIYSNATTTNNRALDEEFINYVPFPNTNQFSLENFHEMTQLKQCIKNFKYKVRINKNESYTNQTTGQFNEKTWLQSVQKTWEANTNNFFLKKFLNLKEKFNLLNHVVINDRNVYYPDE